MIEGVKNAIELPKRGFFIDDVGGKITMQFPKKEILMGDVGDKKCSRITKRGNFDG